MATPATVQAVALEILKDQGIYTLVPSGPQANFIRPSDITSAAMVITQALQILARHAPAEVMMRPGSGYIFAPVNVVLQLVQGSTDIVSFGSYANWMPGCTIQINGDPQDNEVLSNGRLGRPYAGASGAGINATVFCDCLTLDDSVERIIGPLLLAQGRLVTETTDRSDFIARSAFPLWGNYYGEFPGAQLGYVWAPFWSLGPKPTGLFPQVYFLDRYYDPSVTYPATRIRLSPMPTQAQGLGWSNKMTPIRVESSDIVSPLTNLVATGATSDSGHANQTYTYAGDVNGYRLFIGTTTSTYVIYNYTGANTYILTSTPTFNSDGPAAYWIAETQNSPLGAFDPNGTATGTVVVTTTDAGGGASDPGTLLNMPSSWIESLLLPVARQIGSGLPTFKNTEIKATIDQAAKDALNRMRANVASSETASTSYL